jgi:dolichyl-phosphate-mannose--protein O-mannosyl transferase
LKISLPSVPGATAASHHAAFLILTLIAILVHFAGLSHPGQVVFDEYHFGKFVNAYCCTRQMIFDIHPPHPKLIMSLFATLGGYTGNLGFTTIGESLSGGPVAALRLWPALTGTMIPLVGFLLLRRWRVPVAWAFAGGLALALDNALLIQTRIMALDGQLILGSMLALWLCEILLEERSTAQRLGLCLGIGAAVALSVSAKFTGLAIIPVIMARLAWHLFDAGMKPSGFLEPVAGFIMALAGFTVVYLIGWKAHFFLLNQPGPGDAFYKVTGNFFQDLFQLHKVMLAANNGITASHPWASPWWGWPTMKKPIYYWVSGDSVIYFAGNPFVWWGLQGSGLLLLVRFAWSAATDRSRHDSLSIGIVLVLFLAWVASYLPYSLVSRGLFLYHYLPPLTWSVLLSIFLWSRLAGRGGFKPRHLMALIVTGFVVAAPVTFGYATLKELPVRLMQLR